jgi:hypothetical protein
LRDKTAARLEKKGLNTLCCRAKAVNETIRPLHEFIRAIKPDEKTLPEHMVVPAWDHHVFGPDFLVLFNYGYGVMQGSY